jgi:uncharacterized protein (TIGR02145 family)
VGFIIKINAGQMKMTKVLIISVSALMMVILPQGCKKAGDNVNETSTVKDFEGNVYSTVRIGTQWWMSKNLKATKYANGDQIGTTTPYSLSIVGSVSPEYNWPYQGAESVAAVYGRLYTWYAATDSRNVCPSGWHVPNDTEWSVFTDYLSANGYGYQATTTAIGKSMAATDGWLLYGIIGVPGNDQASNNKSGFAAMPAGIRLPSGTFQEGGESAYYWSSTGSIPTLASYQLLSFDVNTIISGNLDKGTGISIRCIKD